MTSGRVICVSAWILAAVAQIAIIASAPDKIVVSGVDLSQANALVLQHQLIFIGVGLVLAVASYWARSWSPLFVIASSALYLIHWIPFKSLYDYGMVATLNTKWVIGSIPGLRWSSALRDVALPIAFTASIAFEVLEIRRKRSPVA